MEPFLDAATSVGHTAPAVYFNQEFYPTQTIVTRILIMRLCFYPLVIVPIVEQNTKNAHKFVINARFC